MKVKYSDTEKYLKDLKPHLQSSLKSLEDKLIEGRDDKGVPIYLTKWRVKSIDSAYLKTKRKSYGLDSITDYGGLRILCMFEQDILPVHRYLVEVLKSEGFQLDEFRIFNWNNSEMATSFSNAVKDHFVPDKYKEVVDNKDSGYKSIHFVVNQLYGNHPPKKLSFEIQLRTLLQDVWGELEHALSYKQGSIHPHIKKSFALLSRDLETSDLLLAHLRGISDKEKQIDRFALQSQGPNAVLWYEDNFLPIKIKSLSSFVEYEKFIVNFNLSEDLKVWAKKGRELLTQITQEISVAEAEENSTKYLISMEKAYWDFCDGLYDEAITKYSEVLSGKEEAKKTYYVPHFRMGEIYFIRGEIEKSLVAFDRCEEILDESRITKEHVYKLKVKLANVYWRLGRDYLNIALEEILQAESIFNQNISSFKESHKLSLKNNLCWYHLEKYLLTQKDDDFNVAKNKFDDLEPSLAHAEATANMFDTAAWFCFHAFKKDRNGAMLIKAKKYCREGWDKKVASTLSITSVNMHRDHTLEILNTD